MGSEPVNVNEYEELARRAMPKMFFDFYRGGAEDEHSLKENVAAFQRIMLRPRVLVDVSRVETSIELLGYKMSSPILVAPTMSHKLACSEGEVATARAAAACDTIMVLAFASSCKIEDVAASCKAVRFYQIYVYQKREVTAMLARRAEEHGFKAIVLTVDMPRLGHRKADIRNQMIPIASGNFDGLLSIHVGPTKGSKLAEYATKSIDPSLTWKDIEWLRTVTKLPILLKGILTAEDARKAVGMGTSGIIVSNHGARQLDYAPATINVLEEVVKAVGGAVPVLFDGGIRRGTDVFKALALGAKAVMVGRPVVYGLAARGEAGVSHVINMLKNELELTMSLCGCPSIGDITRMHVQTKGDQIRSLL